MPSKAQARRMAVIIVNYRTATLTIDAVESILAQENAGLDVSVHVVDNASPEDDAAVLSAAHEARGWGDRVTLYPEAENHGFGRGNNLVIEALKDRSDAPEAVFLLNPDARLVNDAVSILAAALFADPRAGAAGAAIVDEEERPASGPGTFPTPMGEIMRFLNFGPADRRFGHLRDRRLRRDEGGYADWVSGAAVMFRLDALRDGGAFDPGFFLYYEEVELMRRLGRRGWPTLYVPEAKVFHDRGASTGRRGVRAAREPGYFYDSWRRYFVLSYGRGKTLALSLALVAVAGFNVAMRRLRGQVPNVPERFFRDHWVHVIRPLLSRGGG